MQHFNILSIIHTAISYQLYFDAIKIIISLDMTSKVFNFDLVLVGAGVFGLSTSIFLATHYPHIKFALV